MVTAPTPVAANATVVTTTAGSISLSPPLVAGTAAGDYVLAGYIVGSSAQTVTPSAGWTTLLSFDLGAAAGGSGRMMVIGRTAVAGMADPVFTLNGTSGAKAIAWCQSYRSVGSHVEGTPLNDYAAAVAAIVVPAVTPGSPANARLVTVAGFRVSAISAITAPGGQTPRLSQVLTGGGGVGMYVGDETLTATTTSGTRTVSNDQATNAKAGINIALVPAATTAPTATLPSSSATISAGVPTTITATDIPGSGTITGRQWTQLSGPDVMAGATGATSAALTFTPTAAGDVVLLYTSTDSNGQHGTAQITYHVTGSTAKPSSVVSNAGAWSPVGAQATVYGALSDADDTTYAESPPNPSAASIVLGMQTLATGTPTITARMRQKPDTPTPVIAQTVRILQGTTVIATRTVNLTPVWTDYTWTLTAGEASGITDRTNFRAELVASVAP